MNGQSEWLHERQPQITLPVPPAYWCAVQEAVRSGEILTSGDGIKIMVVRYEIQYHFRFDGTRDGMSATFQILNPGADCSHLDVHMSGLFEAQKLIENRPK